MGENYYLIYPLVAVLIKCIHTHTAMISNWSLYRVFTMPLTSEFPDFAFELLQLCHDAYPPTYCQQFIMSHFVLVLNVLTSESAFGTWQAEIYLIHFCSISVVCQLFGDADSCVIWRECHHEMDLQRTNNFTGLVHLRIHSRMLNSIYLYAERKNISLTKIIDWSIHWR